MSFHVSRFHEACRGTWLSALWTLWASGHCGLFLEVSTMKMRTLFSLVMLFSFVSMAFVDLPRTPQEFLGIQKDAPGWINTTWIPNLDDVDKVECFLFLGSGQGVWTSDHNDSSAAVKFDYEVKSLGGKSKYALLLTLEDGEAKEVRFSHSKGRYPMDTPNKRVVWTQRVTFKKAPFKGASKVFYGHQERRG